MTRLLLDHPWPLHEALELSSEAYGVIFEFAKLIESTGLKPAPFVDQEQYDAAKQQLNYRHSGVADFFRFANKCIRHDGGPMAVPVTAGALPNFSDSWQRALRAQLEDISDWRNPQIIVTDRRADVWGDAPEVLVRCLDRQNMQNELRVVARLNRYHDHPFAHSDVDPWCQQEKLKKPQPDARINHPCRLPRHPVLSGATLETLVGRLDEARRIGWCVSGYYYFVPPSDWDPANVSKPIWRSGYAFKSGSIKRKGWFKKRRSGPVDYEGRIWSWDENERHWDVQTAPHMRISHTGKLLPQKH